jgi:hypothetical protein
MCWDIAGLLLASGCSGTGRLARWGSGATPARDRVCLTVTWNTWSIGHAASAASCHTSPESFIYHFAAEALLR